MKVTTGQCWCLLGSPDSLFSGSPSARGCMEMHLILLLGGYLVLLVLALAFDFDIDNKDVFEPHFRDGSWRTGFTLKNLFFPPPRDVPRWYWTSLLSTITHRSGEMRFLSLPSSTCYCCLLLNSDFKYRSLNTSYIQILAVLS